ncbi:hypothetical protein [Paenibacillus sp. FSL E2-0190]
MKSPARKADDELMGYGLRVTGYGLRVTGYGLRVTDRDATICVFFAF